MYLRLFANILDSSLMKEDAETRWLFITMLIIADENLDGTIDMPVFRLAARAALTEEATRRALDRLMQPDPDSRSPENDGRRIEPLGDHRGWRIVTWEKHREIRTKAQMRENWKTSSKAYRERKRAEST